jgi:hypothetical protein
MGHSLSLGDGSVDSSQEISLMKSLARGFYYLILAVLASFAMAYLCDKIRELRKVS